MKTFVQCATIACLQLFNPLQLKSVIQKSNKKSEVSLTVCNFELSCSTFHAMVSKHSTTIKRLHPLESKSIKGIANQDT